MGTEIQTFDSWFTETDNALSEEWEEQKKLFDEDSGSLTLEELRERKRTVTNVIVDTEIREQCGRPILDFAVQHPRYTMDIFRKGDLVKLLPLENHVDFDAEVAPSGTVTVVERKRLHATFDNDIYVYRDKLLDLDVPLRLDLALNDRVRQIHVETLTRLRKNRDMFNPYLMPFLFPLDFPENEMYPQEKLSAHPIKITSGNSNEPQRKAIEKSLNNKMSIIQGPPGTGKTTTIVEIVLQCVEEYGQKVMVCAPSNVAADNIVRKLLDKNIVRIGNPTKIADDVLDVTLEGIIKRSENGAEYDALSAKVTDLREQLYGVNRVKGIESDHTEMKNELNDTLKKLWSLLSQEKQKIYLDADIVVSTCIGSNAFGKVIESKDLEYFHKVIIDEAAQGFEIDCLVPLQFGKSLVLVGDHKQLAPTIIKPSLKDSILTHTMFERMQQLHGGTMLTVQYRMHQLINDWPSHRFYDGQLQPGEGIGERDLRQSVYNLQVPMNAEDPTGFSNMLQSPLLLIDTVYANTAESRALGSHSTENLLEARHAIIHAKRLYSAGVPVDEIAIISPYAAQVSTIQRLLQNESEIFQLLEVKSVDSFQGSEKTAIIISFVRSNQYGGVGFLNDERRMNVALTRAKAHLCLICDSKTILRNHSEDCQFLISLVDYFNEHANIEPVMEKFENITPLEVKRQEKQEARQAKDIKILLKKLRWFFKDRTQSVQEYPVKLTALEREAVQAFCSENHPNAIQVVAALPTAGRKNKRKNQKKQLFIFKNKSAFNRFASCAPLQLRDALEESLAGGSPLSDSLSKERANNSARPSACSKIKANSFAHFNEVDAESLAYSIGDISATNLKGQKVAQHFKSTNEESSVFDENDGLVAEHDEKAFAFDASDGMVVENCHGFSASDGLVETDMSNPYQQSSYSYTQPETEPTKIQKDVTEPPEGIGKNQWLCLVAPIDVFKKLAARKILSWTMKKSCFDLFQDFQEKGMEMENKLAKMKQLTETEEQIYHFVIDLTEKKTFIRNEMKRRVDERMLTFQEKESLIKELQGDSGVESVLKHIQNIKPKELINVAKFKNEEKILNLLRQKSSASFEQKFEIDEKMSTLFSNEQCFFETNEDFEKRKKEILNSTTAKSSLTDDAWSTVPKKSTSKKHSR